LAKPPPARRLAPGALIGICTALGKITEVKIRPATYHYCKVEEIYLIWPRNLKDKDVLHFDRAMCTRQQNKNHGYRFVK